MKTALDRRLALAVLLALPATVGAEVAIQQVADRSVAVRTTVYTAKIDAKGNLTELSVKDAKAFTHPFGDPGQPPAVAPAINVTGQMVAVRSGQARIEWTFGEDRIDVLTEGYNYECRLDPSVKIVLENGGKSHPYDSRPDRTAGGGVIGLVLDNGLTALAVAGGKPFLLHVHSPRILPNHYTGGFGKPGDLYEVTGDMPGGKPFRALYEVPAGDGPHRYVLLSSQLDHLLDQKKLEVVKPGWKSDATMPVLWVSAAEAATYGRWTSAEDNNLLENILIWLRGVDYLKSRPEVLPGSIRLFGASRGGPLVLITAARRPADIAGAAAHVHTSCGIGWTHKPYYGWGIPGGVDYTVRDAAKVAWFAAMAAYVDAAYVDPVNHAQDIRCPITFAYGISDWGLSPPEGIEAAYQLCGSAWKRISRDAGGHVFTAGTRDIMKQLDEHLLSAPGAVDQSHIMKEH